MEYTKINCILQPDTEITREILISELGNIGYESFTETDKTVEGYIPSVNFSDLSITEQFPDDYPFFKITYTSEIIADQNWNEEWEKNDFQPLIVSDRCLIRAPYHTEYPKAEYEIVINPGMAFGTGNHETTTLMIEEIFKQNLNDKTVLDMGCGTGVLGILASMRGAAKIIAIDIDTWAVNSTTENASNNKISNLEVHQGGAETIPEIKFDFIYANIHRNILVNDMPQYTKALKKGGELAMSGFYENDLTAIKDRAAEMGLKYSRHTERQGWVAAFFHT